MPLTFEEVEDWTRKTGTLEALQGELSQRTTTLSTPDGDGHRDRLAGNEIESEASRVLWAANQGEIGTDGLKDADQAANAGAHFALDSDADPQEVEDWWNGLSPEQQQWMVANWPDWVRNRDGIPTVVRDDANMRWVDGELTRLQAELDRELAAHPNPNAPPYGIRADELRRKIGPHQDPWRR